MNSRTLKDAAIEFLTLVAGGKVSEAYERYVGPGFRHHNAYFPGDAASLKDAMQANAAKNPGKVLEVQRALQDGDEVAVFSHVRQRPDDLGLAQRRQGAKGRQQKQVSCKAPKERHYASPGRSPGK